MSGRGRNILCLWNLSTERGERCPNLAWGAVTLEQCIPVNLNPLRYRPRGLVIAIMYISLGGGPRVVVSTAAFHARVRGSVPGLGGLKKTKMFLPHPRVKLSLVGSLHDREVACSSLDRQGSNFESRVWRTVSTHSPHQPQEVLLAQFSLCVHKGGLKPDSFGYPSKNLKKNRRLVTRKPREWECVCHCKPLIKPSHPVCKYQ